MEKSDVYNMRVVPLMRKINIVKDGKTKSIVEENISMNEIRNMSCEPRMLIRKDDDVYFTELPINYHGTKMRWSIFYLYDELNDLEKERFASRTITIPVTVDSVTSGVESTVNSVTSFVVITVYSFVSLLNAGVSSPQDTFNVDK